MAKFRPQWSRIMYIDRKIKEGMKSEVLYNATTLARDYQGVSPKTIQRDIAFMRDSLHAPLEYNEATHGYYYTEENYSLPGISITESDLFAVCIAEKALKMYKDTPLYTRLASVFEKIEASLSDKISIEPSWVDSRYSFFSQPSTTINPEIWSVVFTALRDDRRLRIEYQVPGTKPYEREIDPYHSVSYRGEWYVIGFCHYRKKILTFGMSRMRKAEALKTVFAYPKDFNADKFLGSHFGIMRGEKEHKVKIKFIADQAPYIKERQWHPSQTIKEHKDGSITLAFTTNDLYELTHWVLSRGSAAKVIAPKELAEAVKQELKESLKSYA